MRVDHSGRSLADEELVVALDDECYDVACGRLGPPTAGRELVYFVLLASAAEATYRADRAARSVKRET